MFDTFLSWVAAHNDELAHAGDGMWMFVAAMVSYYMVKLIRKTKDNTVCTLATGILLVGFSSVIHRGWWLTGTFLAPEGAEYAEWAYTYNGLLTLVVVLICSGYSLHIKTALAGICGPLWCARPLLTGVLGAIVGMNL